ncbi:ACT domain-containing protein [Eubacterium aggregans]|uniref:ACT domain-containing protein n=1 Tax=Eubacterium aggregans TaxID=81409 RepID=UPI003F3121EF
MIRDYLIVNKKILPDYFDKVLEARMLLESAQCKSISDAVKQVGISRSTYYKYKDHIFRPSEDFGRKFTLSLSLADNQGILAKVLGIIRERETSVVTIHQDIPINHAAFVIITLDGQNLTCTIDALIDELSAIDGIHEVNLVAME